MRTQLLLQRRCVEQSHPYEKRQLFKHFNQEPKIVKIAVVWFRNALRIHDNPVLSWAYESENVDFILPIYIFEEEIHQKSTQNMGEQRLRFQFDCVENLHQNLKNKLDLDLHVFSGDYLEVLESIREQLQQFEVILLEEYSTNPRDRKQSELIEKNLINTNQTWSVKSFPSSQTILDIEAIVSSPGYKPPKSMKDMVRLFKIEFGDYENIIFETNDPNPSSNERKQDVSVNSKYQVSLDKIRPSLSTVGYFHGGENEAITRLEKKVISQNDYVNSFNKPKSISTNIQGNPMEPTTTGLSPYISTGCLSIRRLWNSCSEIQQSSEHTVPPVSIQGQIMFREMFYLLSRSVENWDQDTGNSQCKEIEWGELDHALLDSWDSGQTGFPLIDAMMRQLNATGWMHHLGRHAVSCFLTRGQLWQNWTHGRDIFERKLIDSDWALNNGNWLWLAGVAPFSMPYYRIYNPCPDSKSSLNVETKDAEFIRYWVPELAEFPSKYIFEPHLAPLHIQESGGCLIGRDYPNPIIDRKESRKNNLQSFKLSLEKLR